MSGPYLPGYDAWKLACPYDGPSDMVICGDCDGFRFYDDDDGRRRVCPTCAGAGEVPVELVTEEEIMEPSDEG